MSPHRTNRRRLVPTSALCIGIAMAAGCAKPLFGPEDERSPFDRFDAVRNQFAPQYVEDAFGDKKPNLRARLSPKT